MDEKTRRELIEKVAVIETRCDMDSLPDRVILVRAVRDLAIAVRATLEALPPERPTYVPPPGPPIPSKFLP